MVVQRNKQRKADKKSTKKKSPPNKPVKGPAETIASNKRTLAQLGSKNPALACSQPLFIQKKGKPFSTNTKDPSSSTKKPSTNSTPTPDRNKFSDSNSDSDGSKFVSSRITPPVRPDVLTRVDSQLYHVRTITAESREVRKPRLRL